MRKIELEDGILSLYFSSEQKSEWNKKENTLFVQKGGKVFIQFDFDTVIILSASKERIRITKEYGVADLIAAVFFPEDRVPSTDGFVTLQEDADVIFWGDEERNFEEYVVMKIRFIAP
jgi:hypothetical protein